jgi:NAD(P)-dependent dehydrogenase (short-subunit alcohol dehydrogenase family)
MLAALGAHIVLLGRDTGRLRAVSSAVDSACGRSCTDTIECDLASFSSVREAAVTVCESYQRLDALINNAALLGRDRTITPDGFESTFQVNHLSHFLLTNLLRAPLVAAGSARVITVSSDAHLYTAFGIHFDDLGYERGWTPFRAYAHSKLANIMFAYELADRWAGTGVSSNAVHPGPVSSGLGRDGWGFWSHMWDNLVPKLTPEKAAEDVVWVAESPELEGVSGMYYYRRRQKRSSRPSYDKEARRRLWEASAALTRLDSEA